MAVAVRPSPDREALKRADGKERPDLPEPLLKCQLPPGAYRRVLEILFEPHADDRAA
jgi:hypothetical protein